MRLTDFLKKLNVYIGADKTQTDFMSKLFFLAMAEADTEEDIKADELDEYYPFAKTSDESTAKKVYSGCRVLPKAIARRIKAHYAPQKLIEYLDSLDETVRDNLCNDMKSIGLNCDSENVGDRIARTLLKFVDAALE